MNVQDFFFAFSPQHAASCQLEVTRYVTSSPNPNEEKPCMTKELHSAKETDSTELRSSCRCLGHRGHAIIVFPAAVRQRGPTALLPLSSRPPPALLPLPLRSQRSRPSRSALPSCHAHWSRTNRPRFPGSFPHCGRHSFPRHAIREVDKGRSCTSRMSSSRVFPPSIHFSDRLLENSPLSRSRIKKKFTSPMFSNNSLSLKKLPT